nr:ribonuclease H-like domain-containing protein [Tanacetum cinerariifolium]
MITRSQSSIVKPIDRLSLHTSSIYHIPKNPSHPLKDPNWCNAMYDEYNALVKNGTWLLVPRPAGVNMVRSMWLFKHKFHADKTLSRYKARLVANGSSQQLGVDFDETFSPVVKSAIICTKKYALQLLERAYMVTCNPSRTPIDTESKLGPESVPAQDPTLYHSLAGRRQLPHFAALKRILRYVRRTVDFGLQLYVSATTSLVGYTNTDWAGCPSTHKSTSGYCVFLGDNILSWSTKRQHTISRSSSEAEYQGVANVIVETAWIRNLLRELHSPLLTATLYVDIFTKGLPTALFEDFRFSLSVRPSPAQTAGAYSSI